MNFFVSGASGFIGKSLTEELLKSNLCVLALTRNINNKDLKKMKVISGDLCDTSLNLSSSLDDCNVIFHCAGELLDTRKMRALHVDGTNNLLREVKSSLKRKPRAIHWIQLSSCGAYGQLQHKDASKERFVNETSPENPSGEYEETKTESDRLVVNFATSNPTFKYTIIRPTIVFGKGMRSTAIQRMASMIKKGYYFYIGNKDATANYIHVDDVVHAMILAANNTAAFNETFIVSNDCTLADIVESTAKTLNAFKPRIVVNEKLIRNITGLLNFFRIAQITQHHIDVMVRKTSYSSNKIKDTLNWQPTQNISIQVSTYIEHLKKTGLYDD